MTMYSCAGIIQIVQYNHTVDQQNVRDPVEVVYFPWWQLICTLPLQHFWDLASNTLVPQQPGCAPDREFTTPLQHIWNLASKTLVPQQLGCAPDREFTTPLQHIWDLALNTLVPQQPGCAPDREFTTPLQHIWNLASKTLVPQQLGRMPDREFLLYHCSISAISMCRSSNIDLFLTIQFFFRLNYSCIV